MDPIMFEAGVHRALDRTVAQGATYTVVPDDWAPQVDTWRSGGRCSLGDWRDHRPDPELEAGQRPVEFIEMCTLDINHDEQICGQDHSNPGPWPGPALPNPNKILEEIQ